MSDHSHLTSKPSRHLLTQLRQLGSAAKPRTQGEALEALEAIEVRAVEPEDDGTMDGIIAEFIRRGASK